jgi:hypothetical protein
VKWATHSCHACMRRRPRLSGKHFGHHRPNDAAYASGAESPYRRRPPSPCRYRLRGAPKRFYSRSDVDRGPRAGRLFHGAGKRSHVNGCTRVGPILAGPDSPATILQGSRTASCSPETNPWQAQHASAGPAASRSTAPGQAARAAARAAVDVLPPWARGFRHRRRRHRIARARPAAATANKNSRWLAALMRHTSRRAVPPLLRAPPHFPRSSLTRCGGTRKRRGARAPRHRQRRGPRGAASHVSARCRSDALTRGPRAVPTVWSGGNAAHRP